MRKIVKAILIVIIIFLLGFLLIPINSGTIGDGGTKEYGGLLCTVVKVHALKGNGVIRGTIVKILGFTVYNDTVPRIEY